MRPPDEEHAALEHEMLEAERALADGRFDDAQQHAEEATRLGAHGHDVVRIEKAIAARRRADDRRARTGGRVGFLIAAVGYLILAWRQPPAWGIAIWAVLALLVVPSAAGFAVGRRQGVARSSRRRFWAALRVAGTAMFLYTTISLVVLRFRVGTGFGGQVVPVILFVSVAYAAAAGLVAGVISAKLAVRSPREEAP